MNEEIKKILENQASGGYNDLTPLQAQELLDYITNLQQCYCNRTDCGGRIKDSKKYDSLLQKYEKLQQENEDLKNRLENAVADCNLRLQENERLKEENKRIFSKVNDDELLISNAMNYAEAQDYKQRIDKTIDYIKNNEFYLDYKTGACIKGVIPLLNILEGIDKNGK